MAWDRPLFLNRPLSPGARAQAICGLSDALSLPEGRLGGGAANAAAALINAGHHAAVASAVELGPVGDKILEAASNIGIDSQFVERADFGEHVTLILIEPSGERTVLGLQSSSEKKRAKIPAIFDAFQTALTAAQARSNFDGLFLRTGDAFQPTGLSSFEGVILTHGPISKPVPSDYIVASRDDLKDRGLEPKAAFAQMRAVAGDRFKALIITAGPEGGAAYTSEKEVHYQTPSVQQVDATGAGDCFAAGFLEAISAGGSLRDALTHGAHWGAQTASRISSALQSSDKIYKTYTRETIAD